MKLRTLPQILLFSTTLLVGACSFFSDKDSSSNEEKSSVQTSSSSEASSSSEETGRLEVDYSDTLVLNDTVNFQVSDSIAKTSPWNFYLGHVPKGTVFHIGLKNLRLAASSKFRVVSESGVVQLPTDALPDGTYSNYATASDTSLLENHFVAMDTGYYYLEVEASRKASSSSKSDFQASLKIDSAYFQFIGIEDSLELPANQIYQGCFRIDQKEDSVLFTFGANAGKNISLVTTGQSIQSISLREVGGATVDSSETTIRSQMLPQDSTTWKLKIKSKIPSYYTGNYAFFTLNLNSIQLGKGEYLAKPDTIKRAGDTLAILREGNENSGWDVRYDHYIYLENLTAGDTVILWHGSDGIERISKLLRVLDSKGNPVDTLPNTLSTNWVKQSGNPFVPKSSGAYYLHFMGIGSNDTYWNDPNYTLHLRAMIQKPHTLSAFNYNPASITIHPGDTISLSELLEFGSISPNTASKNYLPLISRSERNVIQDSVDLKAGGSASGDEVRSRWMVAMEEGSAHLLVQSTADPSRIDTCVITVQAP